MGWDRADSLRGRTGRSSLRRRRGRIVGGGGRGAGRRRDDGEIEGGGLPCFCSSRFFLFGRGEEKGEEIVGVVVGRKWSERGRVRSKGFNGDDFEEPLQEEGELARVNAAYLSETEGREERRGGKKEGGLPLEVGRSLSLS